MSILTYSIVFLFIFLIGIPLLESLILKDQPGFYPIRFVRRRNDYVLVFMPRWLNGKIVPTFSCFRLMPWPKGGYYIMVDGDHGLGVYYILVHECFPQFLEWIADFEDGLLDDQESKDPSLD